MKKSEKYRIAMDAVLDSGYSNEIKLEVLETLMAEKNLAKFSENQEETKE